jgi:superfamily I DNA/RNA helicase
MSVVYRSNWMGEKLKAALERPGAPVYYLDSAKTQKQLCLTEDTIKLMTMHSSKGLEFPVVAISGIGYMPAEHTDKTAEAKLLYVAMTRATEKLLLTSHQESAFFTDLLAAQAQQPRDEQLESPVN